MSGMCFWGEHFEFRDLPHTDRISLLIHKDKGGSNNNGSGGGGNSNVGVGAGVGNSGVGDHARRRRRKKAKKPVGRVRISIQSVQSR